MLLESGFGLDNERRPDPKVKGTSKASLGLQLKLKKASNTTGKWIKWLLLTKGRPCRNGESSCPKVPLPSVKLMLDRKSASSGLVDIGRQPRKLIGALWNWGPAGLWSLYSFGVNRLWLTLLF